MPGFPLSGLAKMMDGFDPSMFQQLGAVLKDAAERIRAMDERMQRIERKLDELVAVAEPEPLHSVGDGCENGQELQLYNGAQHG